MWFYLFTRICFLYIKFTGKNTISLISYNCNSASIHKIEYIRDLVDRYMPEFIFLQETWLLDHNMKDVLKSIHKCYIPHGVSSVEERRDVMRGRPYGGCAILWHNSVSHRVEEISCTSKRICAIKVKMDNDRWLLVACCYMPNDNMSSTHVTDEFVETCSDLQNLIENNEHDDLLIAADWNTDFSRLTAQSKYLTEIIPHMGVKCSWDHTNSVKEDTFYHFNGSGSSCIDYFLIGENMFKDIISSVVVWDGINLSPHQPVLISVEAKCPYKKVKLTEKYKLKVFME